MSVYLCMKSFFDQVIQFFRGETFCAACTSFVAKDKRSEGEQENMTATINLHFFSKVLATGKCGY